MTSERIVDGADWIAQRAIGLAARLAPDDLTTRLAEEWLGDVSAQRGPLAKLGFALGCWWAAYVITREHAPASVPLADAAMIRTLGSSPAEPDMSLVSNLTITFILVVSLHAAVVCSLAMGLGPSFSKSLVTYSP